MQQSHHKILLPCIHFKLTTYSVYSTEEVGKSDFNDIVDLGNGYYLGNEANNGGGRLPVGCR